jgi:cellulose synthase/poly-beta-1,6-N-acetylglucosamine synthase-like glycosyltransferase
MITPSAELDFILFAAFVFFFLVLMYFYLVVFRRLAFYSKKKEDLPADIPVTIVIAAKNEEENLQRNLPHVLAQDYPEFEVIVINDFSSDDTGPVLEEFQRRYNNFRAITIKQEGSHAIGKKYPLTLGIKGAKYETVLLTDADCKPKSPYWLRNMVRNYKPHTEIVLGYGGYERVPGLLNKLIRFDTFYVALQYLSFAIGRSPYMGVGRNLSYKTPLFFKNKGFASHTHIPSGDDDLFINKVATSNNTEVEISHDAHTVSKVKRRWSDWVRQKRRHLTTGNYYNLRTKLLLGLLNFSNILFVGAFVALLLLNYQINLIVVIFVSKLIIQLTIFKKSMGKLGEKDLWFFSPFFELFLIFYHPYLFLTNRFFKQNRWK